MSTFRAYLITPPAGSSLPREWGTVGGEAGRKARELGGTAEALELPATKAGLIPFLNSLEAEHAAELDRLTSPAPIAAAELEADELAQVQALPPPRVAPTSSLQSFTGTAVVAWLLEEATQRDVELVFEAIGVHAGELFRAARAA
jgi:hypothetical protein